MPDAVSMGEVMVQFNSLTKGPLRHVTYFEKHAAGAEANFTVGVVRMGLTAGLISRVGDDEFGRYILSILRGEGVDVSRVITDDEAPTGIYFVQRGYPIPGKSLSIYYRKGSAASRLSPQDLDNQYLSRSKVFHITGITPALSETARAATYRAVKMAKEAHVKVSLDTNIRPRLWDVEEARKTLLPLVKQTDILLTDPQDSEILIGVSDPEKASKTFLKMGPSITVLKMGRKGSLATTIGKTIRQDTFEALVEDVTGAGDAFAACFISSLLKGWSLKKALEVASVAGSLVVTVRGDVENIPTMQDIDKFLESLKKG